jgi:hypothetical protein
MMTKTAAIVRGRDARVYAEGREDQQVEMNPRGDLIVAQGLPELTELVRLGASWQINATTGQAALTALPTTTAGLTLVNNEPATGRLYAIDSFGSAEEVIDATQTDVTALFAMINKRTSTAPSAGTLETTFISLSGRPNYDGDATVRRGATVTNDGWTPHGTPGAQMAAVAGGANWKVNEALVRGLYLVPPGGAFSVQTVKAAAAAAAQQFFFIRWHEVVVIWKS